MSYRNCRVKITGTWLCDFKLWRQVKFWVACVTSKNALLGYCTVGMKKFSAHSCICKAVYSVHSFTIQLPAWHSDQSLTKFTVPVLLQLKSYTLVFQSTILVKSSLYLEMISQRYLLASLLYVEIYAYRYYSHLWIYLNGTAKYYFGKIVKPNISRISSAVYGLCNYKLICVLHWAQNSQYDFKEKIQFCWCDFKWDLQIACVIVMYVILTLPSRYTAPKMVVQIKLVVQGWPAILGYPPQMVWVAFCSFRFFFNLIGQVYRALSPDYMVVRWPSGRQILGPLPRDSDRDSIAKKTKISNFGCTGTIWSIRISRSKSVKIRDFLFF